MRRCDCGCRYHRAPCGEGKRYLCAVKDAFSGGIVGNFIKINIADWMRARLAVDAILSAIARRRIDGASVAGCLVHSDGGSQSGPEHSGPRRHDLVGSMGRVGAAGDNAAIESFFSLLQNNVLDRRRCSTRQQPRIAIINWIEGTSHRGRRHNDSVG